MDFVGAMKAIEQFAYELMSWVLFYPLTIARVVFRPAAMMDYVVTESAKDETDGFSTAMRPTLFLVLSLSIGAMLVPFSPQEIAALSQGRIGKAITESWVALIFSRTVLFTFFPIAGALIYDIFTPGDVARETLRLPFAQQCYILAPFALIVSPCMVLMGRGSEAATVAFVIALAWLAVAQFLFFRRQAKFRRLPSVAAAFGVIFAGFASMIAGANLVIM